jgi:heme exporter protein A
MTALELEGLSRRFGEREALDDVSLALEPGQTLVVFGPNGAGKSTLLRVLSTLLRPSGGSARVFGHDVVKEGWAVRGRIGFLGHQALCYEDLTARENLTYHARLHGLRRPERRIDELLASTGLAGRADDRAATFSRGMLQRLAVCRAVLHGPELLLLDEPRSGLDPAAAETVEPLIGRESGLTRVVASHDPAGGLAEGDLALGLRDGRAELLGPAADFGPVEIGELYR